MMHTYIIQLNNNKRNTALCKYLSDVTSDFRCMRNTANFYIRNTMTGLRKSPEERTHLETEVLHYVFTGIQKANQVFGDRNLKKLHEMKLDKVGGMKSAVTAYFLVLDRFQYPTANNWFLSYETLDAIFKFTDNEVYRRMTSQVNQNAIKKTVQAWKSYFSALKEYRKNPKKFTGRPRIPGYIKAEQATVQWTNQVAKLKFVNNKAYIRFTKCDDMLCIGSESNYAGFKYIKAEVRPEYGKFFVMVTMEDKVELPALNERPSRMLGIDLGLDNFVAAANNCGVVPFVIKGGALKSVNQWYNKERARLTSELTKGKDSQHSQKQSRALWALSNKRYDFIRDFFYKCAWYICRYAKKCKVQVIVVGHNKMQKQDVNMGKVNNQAFVSVPFDTFRQILINTAAKCSIPVVLREESYTSKASILDLDDIPVYEEGDKTVYVFSGKRTKRGLYQASDGRLINADVNGAGNIIRKEYPYAFDGLTFDYLYKTTLVVKFSDLYKEKPKSNKKTGKRHKRGYGSKVIHAYRKEERRKYRELFEGKKSKISKESKEPAAVKAA